MFLGLGTRESKEQMDPTVLSGKRLLVEIRVGSGGKMAEETEQSHACAWGWMLREDLRRPQAFTSD